MSSQNNNQPTHRTIAKAMVIHRIQTRQDVQPLGFIIGPDHGKYFHQK
jgi:hypothetical protein